MSLEHLLLSVYPSLSLSPPSTESAQKVEASLVQGPGSRVLRLASQALRTVGLKILGMKDPRIGVLGFGGTPRVSCPSIRAGDVIWSPVQGYLAQNKPPPPRTYERGTPVVFGVPPLDESGLTPPASGTSDHAPCTLHPAPCTLHPAPCNLHPAP